MVRNKDHLLLHPNILKFFFWPLVFYLVFLGAYTAYLLYDIKVNTLKEIDSSLEREAYKLPSLLDSDFQDRAVAADSISIEEELVNRQRFNDFAKGGNFIYVYTLIEKDGKFYFTASNVTEEEAAERESWYFYPYEDVPPEFVFALESGKTQFVSYQDGWGTFRSVAIPMTSPLGRHYLACIDVKQSVVEQRIARTQWIAGFTTISFSLMIMFFLYASYKAHKAVIQYSQIMMKETNKLRQEAEYDALTGLLNNRSFFREAQEVYADVQCGAVMMLDCDYFKQINDQYGHLTGDKALIFLSRIYQQVLPKETVIGRYGGDEFMIFMPEVDIETLESAAMLIIDTLKSKSIQVNGIDLYLSVSIGAVWFSDNSHLFLELVDQADKALLDVKRSRKKPGLKITHTE